MCLLSKRQKVSELIPCHVYTIFDVGPIYHVFCTVKILLTNQFATLRSRGEDLWVYHKYIFLPNTFRIIHHNMIQIGVIWTKTNLYFFLSFRINEKNLYICIYIHSLTELSNVHKTIGSLCLNMSFSFSALYFSPTYQRNRIHHSYIKILI